MCKKIKLLFLVFLFALGFLSFTVQAEKENPTTQLQDLYEQTYQSSQAPELFNKLPSEVQKELENLGVESSNIQDLAKLNTGSVFSNLFSSFKKSFQNPMKILLRVVSLILLCALVSSLKLSFEESSTKKVISVCTTLCLSLIILDPIVNCINYISGIIHTASNFMLSFIPISVAIMFASGQTFSATSLNLLLLSAMELISQISSQFIVPVMNAFLAISVASSISPGIKLHSLTNMFSSISKWTLGIVSTIFVSLLGIQSIVSASADSFNSKTIKLAVSSFVPLVGGTLSEAFGTMQSCIRLLKSGVGAFAIIAIALIFLPAIVECVVWILTINIAKFMGDILDIETISNLLSSISKVLAVLLAVTISCVSVFLISSLLMLIIGGGIST